tara:strand:- start:417 stop:557 length:141 start_codon:yes stop_codon:yes gene_type:complete
VGELKVSQKLFVGQQQCLLEEEGQGLTPYCPGTSTLLLSMPDKSDG